MRNVMVLREPSYKVIRELPKWCCSWPGCPHILAGVINCETPKPLLELPRGYGYLRHYSHRPFYGPFDWLGGPARWIQVNSSVLPDEVKFHRELDAELQRQGDQPIRLKMRKLPVYIACRAGHAIYEMTQMRGTPA